MAQTVCGFECAATLRFRTVRAGSACRMGTCCLHVYENGEECCNALRREAGNFERTTARLNAEGQNYDCESQIGNGARDRSSDWGGGCGGNSRGASESGARISASRN